jgi:hypothetical protein
VLAAGMLGMVPSALALELADLDGSNGFVINGIDAGDRSGHSVSSAGDVNGDGIDDIIIGAPRARPGGRYEAGESYVVFGRSSSNFSSLELSALDGTNGFVLIGIDVPDRSGWSVSSAGDFNGDGIDDLIVGAAFKIVDDRFYAGESYVVFGHTGTFAPSLELSTLNGTNGLVIKGNAGSNLGYSVSSAGDVNGDGIDDLILGAFGSSESYVVFGHTRPIAASLEVSTLNGSNGFMLKNTSVIQGGVGHAVSGAGDVNGDGIDDVVIGAHFMDAGGIFNAGESYVVFGHTSPFGASLELSALHGADGFTIQGIGGHSGSSVSAAGDLNGDGVDDVIIGAVGRDPGGRNYAGESYVVFGHEGPFAASFALSDLDGSNGFAINGANEFEESGTSVSGAGDVNGDGIDDVIVGSFASPGDKINAGRSYVVYGRTEPFAASLELSALDGSNGFAINGSDAYDVSGSSVSAARDINGDGFDDLIIGASGADPDGRSNAGESYVVFGMPSPQDGMLKLVNIDIKPGDRRNVLNPRAKHGIWVAVLSDSLLPFDPLQIDIPRVQFGPDGARAIRYRVKDVNKDCIEDLILRFRIRDSGIDCGDTKAKLKGRTFDGQRFRGRDAVKTVGCEVKSPHWENHDRKMHHEQ